MSQQTGQTGQTGQTDRRVTDFAGLRIGWDHRVLQPRAWTAEQSRWITELATTAPDGPILELCCGAGQIGLLAARATGRDLIQVDRDRVAAEHARRNAADAGIDSDVRTSPLAEALAVDETFPLVIVDPPWLATDRLGLFPEDPRGAVDGGPDGLRVVREAVAVALAHLAPGGHVVVQVGDAEQAGQVADRLRDSVFTAAGQRHCPAEDRAGEGADAGTTGGVLLHLCHRSDVPDPEEHPEPTSGGPTVSEVNSLAGAGEPIFPSDATAGYPLEGEDVQEGTAGPDAAP